MVEEIASVNTWDFHTRLRRRFDGHGSESDWDLSKQKASIQAIFTDQVRLQPDDNIVFIFDSETDLTAASLFISAAQSDHKVDIYYIRDMSADDISEAASYLGNLTHPNCTVRIFDLVGSPFQQGKLMHEFRENINSDSGATIGFNLMNGSYTIRSRLGLIARRYMPMVEMPGVDVSMLASPAFTAKKEDLLELGLYVTNLMRSIDTIRIVSTEGMDLSFSLNPSEPWINEAENDFTRRRKTQPYRNGGEYFAVDNLPAGEVYKNIIKGTACGRWIIYQLDTDVLKWAAEMNMCLAGGGAAGNPGFEDPVILDIWGGMIVGFSSATTGTGRSPENELFSRSAIEAYVQNAINEHRDPWSRAEVFQLYLLSARCRDNDPYAVYRLSEFAFGINLLARLPEEGAGTLEWEKGLTIHIANGNSPVQDPNRSDPRNYNISDTHTDHQFRGIHKIEGYAGNHRIWLQGLVYMFNEYFTQAQERLQFSTA